MIEIERVGTPQVVLETHESWRGLVVGQRACPPLGGEAGKPTIDKHGQPCSCQFDDAGPCWVHGTLAVEDPPGH
jgi:hypothetical protein